MGKKGKKKPTPKQQPARKKEKSETRDVVTGGADNRKNRDVEKAVIPSPKQQPDNVQKKEQPATRDQGTTGGADNWTNKDVERSVIQSPGQQPANAEKGSGKDASIIGTSSRLVPIPSMVLLIGAVSVAAYAFSAISYEDPCEKIIESLKAGKVVEGADMNQFKIHTCIEHSCKFDLSKCEMRCPLAFESDVETGCPVSCVCATHGVYQGDIRFGDEEAVGLAERYGHRAGSDFSTLFADNFKIWNDPIVNGRMQVPCKMAPDLDTETLEVWHEAVKDFSRRTCIDMIQWTNQKDFLNVVQAVNCASKLGRIGGMQTLEMGLGCRVLATLQHVLLHAFGLEHEQARPDRDIHVNVHEDNIKPIFLHNFDRIHDNSLLDLGSKYDKESAMHYRSDDFAKPEKMSLTFKPDGREIVTLAKDRVLTNEDMRKLNLLYKCKMDENMQATVTDWSLWSQCSKSCMKGLQTRQRNCVDFSGNEVKKCPLDTFKYRECNLGPCPPADGVFDPWEQWGTCNKECGIGKQTRYRSCPMQYKNGCEGLFGIHHDQEYKVCRLKICDGSPNRLVQTGWTEWTVTKSCNATCGGGFIEHQKSCTCEGSSKCHLYNCDPEYNFVKHGAQRWTSNLLLKWTACNRQPCNTPATQPPTGTPDTPTPDSLVVWSDWGQWGRCDTICGKGKQVRLRGCSTGFCPGDYFDSKPCLVKDCSGTGSKPLSEKPFEKRGQVINSICAEGDLSTGMFNSDQLEDFICYTAKEGLIQLYFASNDMMSERVSWKGTATACNHAAMENVFINDVNGDKLDDLVCRNPTTRNIEVFVNKGGYFGSNSDWSGQMGFCQNEKDILNVYDMNGDGKGDLICGDQENAAKLLVVFQALE